MLESNGSTATIEEITKTGSVVQQSALLSPLETNSAVPIPSTSHNIANDHVASHVETWIPSVTTKEDVSNFDMQDMSYVDGQSIHSNFVDMEWEALVTSASELNDIGDIDWDFSIQEVPDFNTTDIDVAEGGSIPSLNDLEPEWRGPFTGLGISDMDDALLKFPIGDGC